MKMKDEEEKQRWHDSSLVWLIGGVALGKLISMLVS